MKTNSEQILTIRVCVYIYMGILTYVLSKALSIIYIKGEKHACMIRIDPCGTSSRLLGVGVNQKIQNIDSSDFVCIQV